MTVATQSPLHYGLESLQQADNPAWRVVPMEAEHCDQIANMHINALPLSFTTRLGKGFLKRLYQCISRSKHAFGLVAVDDDGKVIGFISCAIQLSRLYMDFIKRHGIIASLIAAPKVFSFKRIKSIVQNLMMPGDHEKLQLPDAEVVSVAVDRSFRSTGIGKRLMERAFAEFEKRQVAEVKVSVGDELPANEYYRKLGFVWLHHIDYNSSKCNANIYVKTLKQQHALRNNVVDRNTPVFAKPALS